MRFYCRSVDRRANNDHANSHVEGAEHFAFLDLPPALKQLKHGKHRPRTSLDFRARPLRQNPRDVLQQSAAGDMRESFDYSAVEQATERVKIADVRPQEHRTGSSFG